MPESRIVVLEPAEQQTVLKIQGFKTCFASTAKDALFQSGAAFPRIPERAHLSVLPDGNIQITF